MCWIYEIMRLIWQHNIFPSETHHRRRRKAGFFGDNIQNPYKCPVLSHRRQQNALFVDDVIYMKRYMCLHLMHRCYQNRVILVASVHIYRLQNQLQMKMISLQLTRGLQNLPIWLLANVESNRKDSRGHWMLKRRNIDAYPGKGNDFQS